MNGADRMTSIVEGASKIWLSSTMDRVKELTLPHNATLLNPALTNVDFSSSLPIQENRGLLKLARLALTAEDLLHFVAVSGALQEGNESRLYYLESNRVLRAAQELRDVLGTGNVESWPAHNRSMIFAILKEVIADLRFSSTDERVQKPQTQRGLLKQKLKMSLWCKREANLKTF